MASVDEAVTAFMAQRGLPRTAENVNRARDFLVNQQPAMLNSIMQDMDRGGSPSFTAGGRGSEFEEFVRQSDGDTTGGASATGGAQGQGQAQQSTRGVTDGNAATGSSSQTSEIPAPVPPQRPQGMSQGTPPTPGTKPEQSGARGSVTPSSGSGANFGSQGVPQASGDQSQSGQAAQTSGAVGARRAARESGGDSSLDEIIRNVLQGGGPASDPRSQRATSGQEPQGQSVSAPESGDAQGGVEGRRAARQEQGSGGAPSMSTTQSGQAERSEPQGQGVDIPQSRSMDVAQMVLGGQARPDNQQPANPAMSPSGDNSMPSSSSLVQSMLNRIGPGGGQQGTATPRPSMTDRSAQPTQQGSDVRPPTNPPQTQGAGAGSVQPGRPQMGGGEDVRRPDQELRRMQDDQAAAGAAQQALQQFAQGQLDAQTLASNVSPQGVQMMTSAGMEEPAMAVVNQDNGRTFQVGVNSGQVYMEGEPLPQTVLPLDKVRELQQVLLQRQQ